MTTAAVIPWAAAVMTWRAANGNADVHDMVITEPGLVPEPLDELAATERHPRVCG
jgi:hypothetical protein